MWLSPHVQDPGVYKGEFHLIDGMGRPVDITWYTAPVYRDSVVLGRIYILHDVSPERAAARLRADFFSRVSHELRTPLTSIQGFAEFILEVTGEQLPDLAREYTEIILQSAKHLKTIFTDMIEISRADTGQIDLHKVKAHVPDIIIDSAARLELQYKARGQKLILDLDDDLPPVHADVSRVMQVITNLLTNAIKYSPEGSTIRIGTQYLATGGDLPDGAPPDLVLPAVLISVLDEGKGLPREEAQSVFLPFFRTEDVKKRKIEGVGLGLAVTRSLVEVHRGKIWVVPVPPATGGCFVFTLPTMRA
jgi:signal transduction histidine kinase